MKILMISPQFFPIVGGYERACERLSVALAARGHVVTVWAERRDKSWPKSEVILGVEVRRLWCYYRRYWHMISSLLSFASFILCHGRSFEIWHVHQYGMHSTLAVLMGKVMRRPVVLKLTSTSYMGINNTLAKGRLPRIVASLHRRLDAVVALTRETAAEAEAFGIPPARIHVLGNGLDTRVFRPVNDTERLLLSHELGLANTKIVLFVGRLSLEKNISGLLRAWALAQTGIEGGWTLVIVGDGPLRKALADEARALALESSVRFVGHQVNIPDWFSSASIYTLTSDREGLSNTMLEAMACGLPMVVTRVSGTSELVEETGSGRVVPVGDINALASALKELVASKLLRNEMGARSRAVIEERFDIDRVAAMHESMYASLLYRSDTNNHII